MADFRIRLLSLAAVATAFAGISYGQSTVACTFGSTGNPTLRSESQTELVADTLSPCTTTGGTTTGSVVLTMSLPVTSKAGSFVSSLGGTTGNSDAVLLINGTGGGAYYGTVSGTQVSFSNVTFPASFTLQASNIRVNASTGGAPQVTETILVSYATVAGGASNNIVSTAQNVGFILSTLGAASLLPGGGATAAPATFTSYTTCAGNVISLATGGNAVANQSFTVVIKELVAGAFKTQTQEGGSYPVGAGVALVGSGSAVGVGTATSATQISLVFANVPASATVYVPQSVTTLGTTLAIANSTPVTTPANLITTLPTPIAFTPVGGTVTVVYTTIAAASTGASNFNIPAFVIFAANSAPAQAAITVNSFYSPSSAVTSPSAAVPNFAVSTATPISASTITLCQTSLLFPFVTNTQGFDTGLVLANTSTDNLSTIPGKTSSAAAQSGTCTLSFYGTGLPTPSTGVNDPLGNNPTAGTHAFLLSAVAPGFQGYVIASCPFLYAHGYAFLAYNLTQSNGAVQGYLAEVLTPGRTAGPNQEAVQF